MEEEKNERGNTKRCTPSLHPACSVYHSILCLLKCNISTGLMFFRIKVIYLVMQATIFCFSLCIILDFFSENWIVEDLHDLAISILAAKNMNKINLVVCFCTSSCWQLNKACHGIFFFSDRLGQIVGKVINLDPESLDLLAQPSYMVVCTLLSASPKTHSGSTLN